MKAKTTKPIFRSDELLAILPEIQTKRGVHILLEVGREDLHHYSTAEWRIIYSEAVRRLMELKIKKLDGS